jgi:hypothetical protein
MTKGNNPEKKHKPIPEALIRARAYENWQIRQREGKDGSPEDDWLAAKESLKLERDCLKLRYFWWLLANPKSQSFTLEIVKTFISAFGIIATISGGIVLYLNYLNAQERLISERFSKAIEQLGSQEEAVRLGGIYALERIATDSPQDHWKIMEVLTSYIRQQSPLPEKRTEEELKKLQRVSIHVQAALTVIGRRNSKQDPREKFLDLSSTNLYRADLKKVNLRQAYLLGAYLKQAYLENADLEGVSIEYASLQEAYLGGANLRRIHLGVLVASMRKTTLRLKPLCSKLFSLQDCSRAIKE